MKNLIIISLILITQTIFSQQQNLPLGTTYRQQISFEINKRDIAINTGFKPLLKSEINTVINTDTVLYNLKVRENFFKKHKENWFWPVLLFDDFVTVEKKNFNLYVNPLFYLEAGRFSHKNLFTTEDYYINTRAIEIKGDIGKKLSFYSSFRENQTKLQPHVYNWSFNRLVVPGQGALKRNFKNLSLFDFSSAAAYLSYTPNSWVNIQIGQDKNFIGEGHRSLLLSDNSTNYPFAKFSFTYKSFKYLTMFTEFRDFSHVYFSYHTKKHGAFNYLSYNYKNRFEIGLFEGVIYKTTDTTQGYYNKFKADYFIPVIGVRTASNGFNSSNNNIIAGINAKAKITNFIQAYWQLAIDNPSQNKMAYQAGFKVFDLLHGKLENHNLYFQTEYNFANPRTYSHENYIYQTWSHYNQELAHPAGSSFNEILLNARYNFKNIFLEYNFSKLKLNVNYQYSNIYMTDYKVASSSFLPSPYSVFHNTITAGYIVNRRTNLQVYTSIDFRTEKQNTGTGKTRFVMFGLKTALSNFYYDF